MKSLHRLAFVSILSVASAGCVHQPPRAETSPATGASEAADAGYQRVLATYETARLDLLACGNAVYDDPRFASISQHIPFNPDLSSKAQLSDQHYPTRQEIVLLFDFDMAFAKCPMAYLKRMRTIAPGVTMIVADGYAKNEYITADLIERKLSWGEYADKRANNYGIAIHSLWLELFQIRRGTSDNYNANPVARQNAADALTRYYQSLQIVPGLRAGTIKPSS